MPNSSKNSVQLVGSVLERTPGSTSSPPRLPAPKTGFPPVQHRTRSAFARSRDLSKQSTGNGERLDQPPAVTSENPRLPNVPPLSISDESNWREEVSRENEKIVANMSPEERELERQAILERFGSGVGAILQRAKRNREMERGEEDRTGPEREIEQVPGSPSTRCNSPTGSILKVKSQLSTPIDSRPSSRTDKRLRFAEVVPQNVHVYESAPSSPKRKPLLLMSPTDAEPSNVPVVSLGTYKGPLRSYSTTAGPKESAEEEGTPQDIRRRFFPSAPAFDPSLEWIQSTKSAESPSSTSTPPTVRFDLDGKPVPSELSSTLPTHLGLHHHAEGEHAGYSLDDILLLSRSTVPAQRASMLRVLARLASHLARNLKGDLSDGVEELKGQEVLLRRRFLAAAVEAVGERGSVGVMAIDLLWECLVQWDRDPESLDSVELKLPPEPESAIDSNVSQPKELPRSSDSITSLPLEYLLLRFTDVLGFSAIPTESLSQLLEVLYRLAQHSNDIANTIVTTPNLISNLFCTFILTPIPPTDSFPPPNPFALTLLRLLARASRSNASVLTEPADSLLRFVTPLPPSSPYPLPLANSLLAGTLDLYAALASYGMYSHIATTASTQFAALHQYILSPSCAWAPLRLSWLALLEAWIVCATDPHQTTPSHEILWSQVTAWSWGPNVLHLGNQLNVHDDLQLWTALWRCLGAWLEGAQVNGVSGGEAERSSVIELTRGGFDCGREKEVFTSAFRALRQVLGDLRDERGVAVEKLKILAKNADGLAAAIRLWVACTPPLSYATNRLESPPFSLPFSQLQELTGSIVNHSLWLRIYSDPPSPPYSHVFVRPLSCYLAQYLRLSRRLPRPSDDLWLAQAFVVLGKQIPGDEDFAQRTLREVVSLLDPEFMVSHRLLEKQKLDTLFSEGGFEVMMPFLMDALEPKEDSARIGSYYPSPQSIKSSNTQRLPPAHLICGQKPSATREYRLPLYKDWIFTPLDHLLRSGTSTVFKSLPPSWDGSEVGIVRATLLLAKVAREALVHNGLRAWTMGFSETVFGCMKVFMLEHEQQNGAFAQEVFRDAIVGGLLDDLLSPFSVNGAELTVTCPLSDNGGKSGEEDLESIATRFLGHGTPFYQYYTDFVHLYDAISFGHPAFSKLLLVPTSMEYPIDYRKFLWGDYGHVLRSVQVRTADVLLSSPSQFSSYLWPVERDPQVVGYFMRALFKRGSLVSDGFLRFIAVHHVASGIWEDLIGCSGVNGEGGEWDEAKATHLLKAVVDQGPLDVLREVVTYKQNLEEGKPLLLPPHCFEWRGVSVEVGEGFVGWVEKRLEFVRHIGGNLLVERLGALLKCDVR
ncbi:hypothetical protein BJ322DRAFT_140937 [Thelephora terrestris]|uniref:RNA polymerase II-associated protein 1 C-terminal domain-containing protein n=1 Tax=Thelephora terrestris TaxID=56493 RepID=A0A9P6HAV7_9AGAM|nr:hypothetical protein BJ322DRAFT_140937 [Thelephora terrestris]